jgi:hypothetical protein
MVECGTNFVHVRYLELSKRTGPDGLRILSSQAKDAYVNLDFLKPGKKAL